MVMSESESNGSPRFAGRAFAPGRGQPRRRRPPGRPDRAHPARLRTTNCANCVGIHASCPPDPAETSPPKDASVQGSKRAGTNLAHFTPAVARRTLDELLGHAIGVRIARLADVIEKDLHAKQVSFGIEDYQARCIYVTLAI